MPRHYRIAILVLALIATLGVATAGASPAHFHANSPERDCEICFTAHVFSYEPTFGITVPTAPQIEQPSPLVAETAAGYQLLYSYSPLTRGPPRTV